MKLGARITILILVFVFACKKDTQTTPSPLTVKNNAGFDEMKAYAFFQPGTYWVYEDSLHPGTLDSVWVTQSLLAYDTVKQANGGIQPGIYPYFLMQTKDVAGNTRDYSCYSEIANFGTYNGLQRVEISWNGPTQYYGEYYFIHNRYIPGSMQSKFTYDSCTFIKQVDSLVINNISYKKIIVFKNVVNIGQFTSQWSRIIYSLSDNKGVIRRHEIDSNRVWNLLRYSVVQ